MHHHPGRFVHDQDVVVLVNDGERNVFRVDGTAGRRRHLHAYGLARAETIAGFLSPTVDDNVAVRDERRGLVAGDVEGFGNGDVEAAPVADSVEGVELRASPHPSS
jgi:hypothetical protein